VFLTHIVSIADKVVYDGEAESVSLPGVNGEFEIVDLHGPIAALLSPGVIKVRSDASHMRRNSKAHEQILKDSKQRLYKSIAIEQGVMRFDGKELHVIVE
jgi:F-type H+-transporting ATPase subunit epsilon